MWEVGSLVGGYRIEQYLATGATGTVWLARNPTLPRVEALKVLDPELCADPAFRTRFVREADLAAMLDHPNIVAIYHRGETDNGQLWIAMQYIAGTDAEAALQAGTMTPRRAMHIVTEVAKALDYAHTRGVIHLDIKPANVLLANGIGEDEHVVLSDFGIAQPIRQHHDAPAAPDEDPTVLATPGYVAPEVITGQPVDGRADVYALACMLFRLLTGKPPFDAEDSASMAMAHLHHSPPRISDHLPGATRQLDIVMARALAKNPAERFSSAREFARSAADALAPLNDTAPPAPTHSIARTITVPDVLRPRALGGRRSASRPMLVSAAAAAVIALIAGVLWLRPTEPAPTSPAAEAPAPTTTTSPTPNPAQDRLARLIPAAYTAGACSPAPAPTGASAAITCGPSTDPAGPTSATYVLARDAAALDAGLADTIGQSAALICPGNMQSPGPWQRNASPTIPRGTLFCGNQSGQPLIAWTNTEQLLLSTVRTQASAGTLDSLYAWWTKYS